VNELPLELRLYRDQLRDAVARDLAARRRMPLRPSLSRRLVLPAVALVAVAVAAGAIVGLGSQATPADAAILHRMVAALTPPAGTILHERAEITAPGQGTQPYEVWMQADSPHAYRVVKWGHEGAFDGNSFSSYDAASNTITIEPNAGTSRASDDFAVTLRSLVAAGRATIDGTTTIDGVSAYKLTVSDSPDPFLLGTAYVATGSYKPLEIDTITGSEKIVFETYEYLPANAAGLRLLDLAAQHSGAGVVHLASGQTGAGTTTAP
jgi:hypothetical protein